MLDRLWESFPNGRELQLELLAFRLGAAFVLGCAVAAVYRLTRRPASEGNASLVPTLVLLTVLICMVTMVIGDNVARAFSLVGALAIVRFRTVVEDTRDTAFVIFAVGIGMAVGAGYLAVPVVGWLVAAVAAFLFRSPRTLLVPQTNERVLTIRVGAGQEPDALLRKVFETHLLHWRLIAAVTARQGVAMDLSYALRLRRVGADIALLADLNRLEGVQSVELRQP
jgi:uncharacterized membrane protein YhiD involved in acid resistance